MPALSQPTYWTVEMVRALPDDGNRYECIDGELLVTPGPWNAHQAVVGEFYRLVFPYVREMGLGYVQVAPTDVEIDAGTMVEPDVLAFRLASSGHMKHVRGDELVLVIEVLSSSTARRDRGIKRALYARTGVSEYWIVDRSQRRVERWRAGATEAEVEAGLLTWHPVGASRPFVLDLPALFDSVPEVLREP